MAINLYSKASVDSLLSPKLSISSLTNAAATTLNATAPTTGQVLSFDGTELKWATVSGGGGVAWGAITGTLSDQTDLNTALGLKAPLASPVFTGTPSLPTGTTAVTQTAGNSTTALATTAFVTTADNLKANIASPTFTGNPTAPTPATSDNDTSIATTAFVKAQGYAPLASPTFTGNPTAPTPTTADNDTSIATTAFVKAQGYATLASPTFTGDPKAPTPATSDNDTSIATTAFVKAQGYLTDAPSDGSTYGRNNGAWVVAGGGGSVSWGGISGTISDQTDLQTELDAKAPLAGPAFSGTATFTGSGGTVSLNDVGLDLSASTGGGLVTVGTSGITFSDSTTQQTAFNPDRAMADAIANIIYTQSSGSTGDICFSNVPQFISNLTTSWGIVDNSATYEYCTGFSGATYSLSGSVGSGPYKVRVNGIDSSFTI